MGTEENLTRNLYGLLKISQEMARKDISTEKLHVVGAELLLFG
jgi:hypothetical protein